MRVPAALALALLVGACAPEPTGSPIRVAPGTLDGTAWQVVAIAGQSVGSQPPMLINFDGASVSGNGPCNAFGGAYQYDSGAGALRLTTLVSTKRACVDPAGNGLEATYFRVLRGAVDASIDEAGRLVITGGGAQVRFALVGKAIPAQSPAGPS